MRSIRVAARLDALLSIADLPGEDDDTRLRKRAGVAAGYITIFAPLPLPFMAPDAFVAMPLALALSTYSVINLLVLARTRRYERYVVVLIAAGAPFVLLANAVTGGITTGGGGLVWAFLVPGYAILALGPRRATPWFVVFVGTLLVAIAIDPIVHERFHAPPYAVQVLSFIPGLGIPLTIVFLLLRYTDVRRRAAEARSEELLTNAIPRSIAVRLKHGEERIAEAYPDTTVVFADIVGFTPWSQRTDPRRVVELLDDLFRRFDALAAEHGVEKVKTVGDAYMAVAGAPERRADHAQAAMGFARAAIDEVASWRQANAVELQIRVGVASGPTVGGVIGQRRLMFDLWGDTVNTAARMESAGVPGRVQLTSATRDLLAGVDSFERREIEVKGLGHMTTYLVSEPRQEVEPSEAG